MTQTMQPTYPDTFRIGNIGRLTAADMRQVVLVIREVIEEMGVNLAPATPPEDHEFASS